MAVSKTCLSAGEIIREILINDKEVAARVKKVYPVVTDDAELPYIVYRRASLEQTPVKSGHGADTVAIEILCYTSGYTEGVDLAEAVRAALDGASYKNNDGDLVMRSCFLTDSEESWADDAYLQYLMFTVRI